MNTVSFAIHDTEMASKRSPSRNLMESIAEKAQTQNPTTTYSIHGLNKPQNAASNVLEPIKKRTRQSHSKVRTGCITCKIRRKKCDEAKPACLRCTSTGRQCDGYVSLEKPPLHVAASMDGSHLSRLDEISTQAQRAYEIASALDLRISRPPSFFPSTYIITDLERHCFSYFRYHTSPLLRSYFDSTIWQEYCINLGVSHPVVFVCGAALGAVHRRFDLGISKEAFEWCGYSDRLVRNARRLLLDSENNANSRDHLLLSYPLFTDKGFESGSSGYGVSSHDVFMTSHMLLYIFETFQNNFSAAVFDLATAIRYLLSRPMRLLYRKTTRATSPRDPQALLKFIERIKSRTRDFLGSEETILAHRGDKRYTELPAIPAKFTSLEQARDYIFTEVQWILQTPTCAWKNEASRIAAQNLHVERMTRWSAAFTETVRDKDRTELEIRAGSLLRLARGLGYYLLYVTFYVNAYVHGHITGSRGDLINRSMADGQVEVEKLIKDYITQSDRRSAFDGGHEGDKESDIETGNHLAPRFRSIIHLREELSSNFHRLQIWGDIVLDPTSPFRFLEQSISFDSAIGPPLDPLPSPKSSGKTRYLVRTLLEKPDENVKGVLGELGVYGLADHSCAIEEHAVLEAVRDRFPIGMDVRWVDIGLFVEDRKLLLQYCCPSTSGQGMEWRQEWWVF